MSVRETIRNSIILGLALIAPLVISFVALQFVLGWLSGFLNPIIEGGRLAELFGNVEIAAQLVALFILVTAIAALGYLTQRRLGAYLFDLFDRAVGMVPLVSVIYGSVRQVSNALMRQGSRYESVVLIEYPRDGLYALGFVTAESPNGISTILGESAVNVYIPNSPNPTAGQLLMVPESSITELEMSVSRGIRLLVTTGIAEDERELEALQDDLKAELDGEDVPFGNLDLPDEEVNN